MSLSKKQISIICILAAVVILAVSLGCVFGIKCTVTLVFRKPVKIYGYDGLIVADATEEVKTQRFATFAPPLYMRTAETGTRFVGWYKDYTCTVPWLTTEKVTSNITLYAKWESINS